VEGRHSLQGVWCRCHTADLADGLLWVVLPIVMSVWLLHMTAPCFFLASDNCCPQSSV
jgi:hypothetical protein